MIMINEEEYVLLINGKDSINFKIELDSNWVEHNGYLSKDVVIRGRETNSYYIISCTRLGGPEYGYQYINDFEAVSAIKVSKDKFVKVQ